MRNRPDGRVSHLGNLRQDIPPQRNLWPAIEAALMNEAWANEARAVGTSASGLAERGRKRFRPSILQVFSVATTVAALAVGIWIGGNRAPGGGSGAVNPAPQTVQTPQPQSGANVAFISDPRYLKQRASLLRGYQAQLDTLPHETREKVGASLATIHAAMKEIESALGRDPANALLQEMLVNIYQDEMRVLTTVQDAANAREI